MTPGFSGAEIENLVNTAITNAVHKGKEGADLSDFEYARDRIMMGIERKKLSMSEKERLNTSIHECGHAIACYFTAEANKLYKATIVARGGSLGATYMVPNESDSLSLTKEKVLARIDVAMGGHVALCSVIILLLFLLNVLKFIKLSYRLMHYVCQKVYFSLRIYSLHLHQTYQIN